MKKKVDVKRIISLIFALILLAGACYFGKEPVKKYVEVKQETDENQEEFKNDVDKMIEFNGDAIAWISISNTNVDYPIVHSKDNKDYLRRNLKKEYSHGGTPFIDYRIKTPFSTGTTIIYGHNLNNGLVFSQLRNYSKTDWAKNHENITVYLKDGEVRNYKVFAFAKVNASNADIYDVTVDTYEERNEYYKIVDKYNTLEMDAPDENHNILMLSTCTNINKAERYVVWAYDIEDDTAPVTEGETNENNQPVLPLE